MIGHRGTASRVLFLRLRLGVIALLAALLSSPMALSDFETEIAAEGGKWAHYYEQADLDGLMTLYVEDAIVALHGQPALFGIDTIRDYFAQRIGKAEATFELDYELRETHGDIAYIISKYWLKATDKTTGALYKDCLLYTSDAADE